MRFLKPFIFTLIVAFLAGLPFFDIADQETILLGPLVAFLCAFAVLATWHLYVPRPKWKLVPLNLLLAAVVFLLVVVPMIYVDSDPYTHMDTGFAQIELAVIALVYMGIVLIATMLYQWLDEGSIKGSK